jgi:hypothetical protein
LASISDVLVLLLLLWAASGLQAWSEEVEPPLIPQHYTSTWMETDGTVQTDMMMMMDTEKFQIQSNLIRRNKPFRPFLKGGQTRAQMSSPRLSILPYQSAFFLVSCAFFAR